LGNYLLNTLIIGALLGNIWEELAWTGVVQHRLMDRRGPAVAALLTAILFALIHLPFAFAEKGFAGTPWTDVAVSWAVLLLSPRSSVYSWGSPTWERATACS
jgi:membrane protease YdiL (CAAX protease family)